MSNLKGKNVLVTGGAGFIGSHLVDALIVQEPSRLVVVDNLFLGRRKNLNHAGILTDALMFYCQDVTDIEAMRKILLENEVEVIFNLSIVPLPTSLKRPKWSVDQNVLMATTLCQLAKEHVYNTLIHFSSSEALGSAQTVPMGEDHPYVPLTPYAASKAAADHIVLSHCETFGIDAAILRPFNNYGPRQNDQAYAGIIPIVINRTLAHKPIEIFGDGLQTRDFLFVQDTVDAAVAMYESTETRGRVTHVASGQEISVNELVKMILWTMNAKDHPIIHASPRPADVRRHCGDITKARKYFGFHPKTELSQGLRLTVDWYLDQAKARQV